MKNNESAFNGGRQKIVTDVIKVAISNIIKLASGILIGFLLPKIIGVTDYGLYKTFTLYGTYVGLLHFGFLDGIILKFGGTELGDLKKASFRTYSLYITITQLIECLIIAAIALFALDGEYKFIFVALSFYAITSILTSYYQDISQVTGRFKELSRVNIIQSLLTIIAIVVLWAVHHFSGAVISYRIYTIIFVSIYFLLMVWYIFIYRELTFGKRTRLRDETGNIKEFYKIGFPLMVANLVSSLLLTVDRQFVNIAYTTEEYAVYAFAYNMLTLITTATSAISTVLYPNMKRAKESTLKANYSRLNSIILAFINACLLVYFPLYLFVNWFLPKYSASLPIFRIVLPALAMSSCVTIVMHNYYKTIGKDFRFFVIGLIDLGLAIGADFIAYYTAGTMESLSWASVIVTVLWYIMAEFYFIKTYHVKWAKNFVYALLMMGLFYGSAFIPNIYIGFGVYFLAFILVTMAFYYRELKGAYLKFKKKREEKKMAKVSESAVPETKQETDSTNASPDSETKQE